MSEPCFVNVFELFSTRLENRSSFLCWSQGESDLDGCINLHSPQPVTCKLALSNSKVPVACLLDKLEECEFTGRSSLVRHTRSSGLFYDQRNPYSKRSYFQCVLASKELFARGQTQFRSDRSAAFYQLMLRSRELPVPENLSALECGTRLTAIGDVGVVFKALCAQAVKPNNLLVPLFDRPARARTLALMNHDPDIDGDCEQGDGNMVQQPDDGDDDDGSPAAEVAPDIDGDVDGDGGGLDLPQDILGCRVFVESHNPRDRGLRVTCCHHEGCKKFRSLNQDVEVFGPRAAFMFLETWVSRAHSVADHAAYKPSRRDIRQYLASKNSA
jgi:hypothetical protein